MNKIHRVIWSAVRQTWVAASEISRSRGRSSTRKVVVGSIATALIAMLPLHAHAATPAPDALPTGGQVVSGQASVTQSGSQMTVNQITNKAILNWNTFNIGGNAAVTFQQPSSSAVALNRVIGADPSAIYGKLSANGQVFLINPNGVLFAPGAHVDVGGLVASTLNISNADFLAGNNRFTRDGSTGSVVNQGELLGKYIALLAPEVRNEGVIAAHQGTVALAAGEAVTLSITGNNLIDVQVDKASINTLVENKQMVQVDAGTVIMSAQSANQLLGQVVNSGTVEANGITSDGGVIRLRASSTIANTGSLSADAAANGKGGSITAIADLTNSNSLTTVDGILSAKGGSVSGDGGFIETSGTHLKIADTAHVATNAVNGKAGTWLLDPNDFKIAAAGGDITGTVLSGLLNANNVIIQTTAGASSCTAPAACGAGAVGTNLGDIIVNDVVTWNIATSLTLDANHDVLINVGMNYSSLMNGSFLNVNYGTGGAGKAVIAAGVNWTTAGDIINLTAAGAPTMNATVNTTANPYWIGAKGTPINVSLVAGTGVYGDPIPMTFFDGANAPINIDPWTLAGTATWTGGALNVGGPTARSYVAGLSSPIYTTFAAGAAANWTVTARPITLTANNLSKTQGTVLNLLLSPTAFSLTAGTMAFAETITGVRLTSASGLDTSTSAPVGSTPNDINITPGSETGANGFLLANYNITLAPGAFTITPKAAALGTSQIYRFAIETLHSQDASFAGKNDIIASLGLLEKRSYIDTKEVSSKFPGAEGSGKRRDCGSVSCDTVDEVNESFRTGSINLMAKNAGGSMKMGGQ